MNMQITSVPPKPATVAGNLAKLPDAFKPYLSQRIWVCWRWTWNAKKQGWDKPPLDPKGFNASSTNAVRWFTYEDTLSAVQAGVVDGIGISVYGLTNSEIVLDLDDCRDPLTGTVAPWAQEIVDQAASYAEVTPSGTGLRVIGHGNVGKQHRRFSNVDGNGGGLEIYTAGEGRYITVSGAELPGCWPLLSDVSEVATRLLSGKGKLHPEQPSLEPSPKAFDPAPAYQPGAIMFALGLNRTSGLEELIRNGAPEGRRSEQFHHAVGLAKREGWTQENLERFMRANPSGIASKYLSPQDRLSAEIDRCWGKVDGPAAITPTPPRLSRFMRASDLEGLPVPERDSLVPGWVPMSNVTLLSGDGGTGKSLLSLQLACSTALGRPWMGLPVKEGRAVYISAEDDLDELHRRMSAIATAENVGLGELHRLTVRSLAGEDALLANLDSRTGVLARTELLSEIDRLMAETRPALIVLDTLADLYPGNENDRAQARQFIGMLRGMAIRHGAAVLVLAHPSLTGISSGTGTSGSTGWSNSVRSRLYFERITSEGFEPNPDARRLSLKKANYSRIGTEVLMTWRDGAFHPDGSTSLTGLDRTIAANKAERVFLALLAKFQEQGRHVSAQPSAVYAPKLFAESPGSEGITKRAFAAAMNALFTSGKIEVRRHGPKSRERSHLVLAGTPREEGAAHAD